MSLTPRTIVTVQTCDGTSAHHYEFKGYLCVTDAGIRARALALANPRLDHTVRGRLISCLNNLDFDVKHVNPTEA